MPDSGGRPDFRDSPGAAAGGDPSGRRLSTTSAGAMTTAARWRVAVACAAVSLTCMARQVRAGRPVDAVLRSPDSSSEAGPRVAIAMRERPQDSGYDTQPWAEGAACPASRRRQWTAAQRPAPRQGVPDGYISREFGVHAAACHGDLLDGLSRKNDGGAYPHASPPSRLEPPS